MHYSKNVYYRIALLSKAIYNKLIQLFRKFLCTLPKNYESVKTTQHYRCVKKIYEVEKMKMGKKRIISMMLATLMLAGTLAGCGKTTTEDPSKPVDPAKPAGKDTIIIATMGEPPSMSPTDHNAIAADYMNGLTFSRLTRMNEDMKMEPALAESYEAISDTEWVFKLRKDVKFHDDSTMKAEDVVASIELAKTCPQVTLYNDSVKTIEEIDEFTVKITTPQPSSVLLVDLAHHGNSILPKKLIDEGNDFNKNPIGTGPYVFKKWTLGDKIEFEMFPEYWDKEHMPTIKNMTWKIIPEGSSRTIALEAGEVDYVVDVEPMDVERIEKSDKLVLAKEEATNHMWMMVNIEKPGLDNVDVRRAMNAAINKDSIVTVALNGLGAPAYSMTPYNMPGASEKNTIPYDVDKAKEYLAKSGVAPVSIKFSIICSNDTKKRAAEVIQADLDKNLGIKCEIETMDLATYLSVTAEGTYTAAIGNYSSTDMTQYMVGVYHSKSVNGSNKTRLANPELDALIDKASQTVDVNEKIKVLEEAATLLNELCPQVPIYQDLHMRAYNKDLDGVIMYPGGSLYMHAMSWKK